jgi:superfamily II DNA or RNA helicase
LEEYQNEAIQKWFEHGRRGIFEMATGTGKTITSLSAAVRVYEEKKRVFLVVIVPYLHLANQWKSTVKIFGFSTILCGSSYMGWKEKLDLGIQNYNLKVTDNLCIIAVSKTASSDRFISSIEKIRKSPIMIIADEVHGLGSLELQKCMQEKYEFRLGLSATPRRWFDDYGTNILFDYFGEPCYEYSLDKAIENGFLVSYLYYPILTNLNNEEHDKYEAISNKIIQLLRVHDTDSSFEETIKKLLIARARILSSAQNKFQMLLELLSEMIKHNNEDGIKTRDILIYCSPGHHKEVLKQVSQLGLTCHEFVADVSSDDRANILKEFENGFYQVLVAIKCLDEGVDVPSTRIAFIMASSTNPREFIQRRGRILRRATNKKSAIIYDFIIVPSKEMVEIKDATEISIIKRELPRFAEFSASASNEFESREKLWNIANKLEILPLLDKKPWEIYADLISSDEGAKYEER